MTQRAIDGDFFYFVTANVQHRRWFFVTAERAAALGQAIETCCQMKNFDLIGYCILPNHFHLLVRKLSAEGLELGNAVAQRRLGSLRCAQGNGASRRLETGESQNTFLALRENLYLYTHRRRPRRRSREHDQSYTLSELMHSIKSTFSHSLGHGKFWQHRSNFRIITSDEYLRNVLSYIESNYRKMNLPERYGQAPFVYFNQAAIRRAFGL